jgi:hypothetical protein
VFYSLYDILKNGNSGGGDVLLRGYPVHSLLWHLNRIFNFRSIYSFNSFSFGFSFLSRVPLGGACSSLCKYFVPCPKVCRGDLVKVCVHFGKVVQEGFDREE